MLLLHLDRFSLWLIWLMMIFPVVPIRKFLAGKNWQADLGLSSNSSQLHFYWFPTDTSFPHLGICSRSYRSEPSLPGHCGFVAAQSSPLHRNLPVLAAHFFRVISALFSKVKTLLKEQAGRDLQDFFSNPRLQYLNLNFQKSLS